MRGGRRLGAGRPPVEEPRKQCTLRATQAEWQLIQRFAKLIKYGDKIACEQFLTAQEGVTR